MAVSKEKIYELIREQNDTSKKEVMKSLKKKIDYYSESINEESLKPKKYCEILLIYLVEFYERIESAVLFDALPDGWIYGFNYEYDEFSLYLEHIKEYIVGNNLEFKSRISDAVYKLITIKPNCFNVEQYSMVYNVGPGTVRQWIRRGKLRTAFKRGNEWLIPHITMPPSRGYEGAQYKWLNGIEDLPEEYKYLADYVIATFFQDRKDRSKYHVVLVSKKTLTSNYKGKVDTTTNKELLLDAKEREKLELFLISHPQVKYCGEII